MSTFADTLTITDDARAKIQTFLRENPFILDGAQEALEKQTLALGRHYIKEPTNHGDKRAIALRRECNSLAYFLDAFTALATGSRPGNAAGGGDDPGPEPGGAGA